MKKSKTAIAIFIMFAMAISIIALPLPTTYAQSTDTFSDSYYIWPVDEQLTDWQMAYLEEVNTGPLSAHVRWVRPFAIGGVAGGETTGEHAFDCGDAYAGKWSTRSIVGGIAYNIMDPVVSPTVTIATDIRTGEELWRDGRLSVSFAQVMVSDYGIQRYLWRTSGSTYSAYDPWTLQWVYDITNVPGGTRTFGENGEIIIYSLSLSGGTMTYWNQSWMLEQPGVIETLNSERSVDAAEIGLTAEWTVPTGLPGSAREYRWGDRVVGTYESTGQGMSVMWAFSLEPGKEGTLLYNTTAEYEVADEASSSVTYRLLGDTPEESAHLHFFYEELKYWAYSYGTGEELWDSSDFDIAGGWGGSNYMDHFGRSAEVVNNNLYTTGYGGVVLCFNATEGLMWQYHATDPYSEILWNNDWPLTTGNAGTTGINNVGGVLYLGHTEHSVVDPKPRGAPFIALNATSGEQIWRADGLIRQSTWGGYFIMGEGIILSQDTYSQRTYCIGKGPSATTVSVPDAAVPSGSSAIISGTVMDISPGCSDFTMQLRFPNGVPAVSDESMSEWMLYVYKQFELPAVTVGVDVSLTVLDSDGQVVEVGTATNDATGYFSYVFTPDAAGEYTVKASFAGSNSYYGSFAVSSPFVVEEAPEPTPTPTPMPESVADAYFVPAVAGVIVALVVVGVLLVLLLLRKR